MEATDFGDNGDAAQTENRLARSSKSIHAKALPLAVGSLY